MPVESDATRLVFLNPDDFGVEALYGGSVALNGIFDSAYFPADVGAGVPIEGAQLRFLCRTSDLPGGGAHGASLVLNATSYVVREVHPDGTGMTELVLERA